MAATILETYRSREATEGDNPTAEFRYVVLDAISGGVPDEVAVRDLVVATAPVTYLGLRRTDYDISPFGRGVFDVTVRYQKRADPQFQFDTTGGSSHVNHSLATRARYAAPGEIAPDFLGAIEVSEEAVNGTDITVPVYSFSETHYLPSSLVTPFYKLQVFALTGRINFSSFKGFSKGEVLFLGASGSKRGFEDWEIQYRFAASPNITGLQIGQISVGFKEGWDYVWTRFAEDVDSNANTLIKKPVAVYVEQLYQYGNFAALGI